MSQALPTMTPTPPGPGSWILDDSHFDRPMTRYLSEAMQRGFHEGMRTSFAAYGVPLEEIVPFDHEGFFYYQVRPVGSPPGASGLPPRPVFWLLARLHPAMRSRRRAAEAMFRTRRWREDARVWEEEKKPRMRSLLAGIEEQDPVALDEGALATHVGRVRQMLIDVMLTHFETNAATIVPVGDFLARIAALSGLSPAEVGRALTSRGSVATEGDRAAGVLVQALRSDEDGRALLDAGEPAAALAGLRARQDGVGTAARAWLGYAENRSIWVGDLDGLNGSEVPHLLIEQLRIALDRPDAGAHREASDDLRESDPVRDRVPAPHRALYDELLAEALTTYSQRDERCAWLDSWAMGLARRTLLEAGRRLANRGRLIDKEHAIECHPDELAAILADKGGPGRDELAARAARRRDASYAQAPAFLGPEPGPPPPAEWFPGALGRLMTAFNVYRSEMEDSVSGETGERVRGIAASGGRHLGTARLVNGPERFADVRRGDVLVARATMPAYNGVLPLLGGIVTDRGGSLSHAAIVSREYGIPGVVGCRDATQRIPDGATVLIDGDRGIVEIREAP